MDNHYVPNLTIGPMVCKARLPSQSPLSLGCSRGPSAWPSSWAVESALKLDAPALPWQALKNYGITAPIDVHMMVTPVDQLIGDFADAGADCGSNGSPGGLDATRRRGFGLTLLPS